LPGEAIILTARDAALAPPEALRTLAARILTARDAMLMGRLMGQETPDDENRPIEADLA
jgi:hypothetical protein